MITVFMGYDPREDEVFNVARHSLIRHAEMPVNVVPLKQRELRNLGLFTRPYSVTEKGQYVDHRDGLPFSTEFSYTRFLVPELARRGAHGPFVVFVDCDWIFFDSIHRLIEEVDPAKKVSVIKHNYLPASTKKMDGVEQVHYRRKLWSSLMVFNMGLFTEGECGDLVGYTNNAPGSFLHKFEWLKDEELGELREEWGWIPAASPTTYSLVEDRIFDLRGIHFTEGSPNMPGYEKIPYADEWFKERSLYYMSKVREFT